MKRKNLETTICMLQDLEDTIRRLKETYSSKKVQIEVLECQFALNNYFVTAWWLREDK